VPAQARQGPASAGVVGGVRRARNSVIWAVGAQDEPVRPPPGTCHAPARGSGRRRWAAPRMPPRPAPRTRMRSQFGERPAASGQAVGAPPGFHREFVKSEARLPSGAASQAGAAAPPDPRPIQQQTGGPTVEHGSRAPGLAMPYPCVIPTTEQTESLPDRSVARASGPHGLSRWAASPSSMSRGQSAGWRRMTSDQAELCRCPDWPGEAGSRSSISSRAVEPAPRPWPEHPQPPRRAPEHPPHPPPQVTSRPRHNVSSHHRHDQRWPPTRSRPRATGPQPAGPARARWSHPPTIIASAVTFRQRRDQRHQHTRPEAVQQTTNSIAPDRATPAPSTALPF